MNEQLVQQPPQEVAQTITEPPVLKKKIPNIVFIAGALVLFILVVLSQVQFTNEQLVVATPTPSPTQKPSEIATASAYMLWHQEVASLAAVLAGFSLTDESIIVPVLEVDLDL